LNFQVGFVAGGGAIALFQFFAVDFDLAFGYLEPSVAIGG